jgi:hypothetical protein
MRRPVAEMAEQGDERERRAGMSEERLEPFYADAARGSLPCRIRGCEERRVRGITVCPRHEQAYDHGEWAQSGMDGWGAFLDAMGGDEEVVMAGDGGRVPDVSEQRAETWEVVVCNTCNVVLGRDGKVVRNRPSVPCSHLNTSAFVRASDQALRRTAMPERAEIEAVLEAAQAVVDTQAAIIRACTPTDPAFLHVQGPNMVPEERDRYAALFSRWHRATRNLAAALDRVRDARVMSRGRNRTAPGFLSIGFSCSRDLRQWWLHIGRVTYWWFR